MGNDRGLIHKGYESGAVDYIEKPVDPVILKSKVRFFLENYHQLKRFEARIRDLEQEMANPEQGQ
jgi:response regulator RpfG family c-di-GMP phosphodiesterase